MISNCALFVNLGLRWVKVIGRDNLGVCFVFCLWVCFYHGDDDTSGGEVDWTGSVRWNNLGLACWLVWARGLLFVDLLATQLMIAA